MRIRKSLGLTDKERAELRRQIEEHERRERSAKIKCNGLVYFISAVGDAAYPIKIGFSYNNVYMRLKNIQVGNPIELRVFATFPCKQSLEVRLHSALDAMCILGEWFERCEVVLAAMAAAKDGYLDKWLIELVDRRGIEPRSLPCKGSAFTMLTRDPEPNLIHRAGQLIESTNGGDLGVNVILER